MNLSFGIPTSVGDVIMRVFTAVTGLCALVIGGLLFYLAFDRAGMLPEFISTQFVHPASNVLVLFIFSEIFLAVGPFMLLLSWRGR